MQQSTGVFGLPFIADVSMMFRSNTYSYKFKSLFSLKKKTEFLGANIFYWIERHVEVSAKRIFKISTGVCNHTKIPPTTKNPL